jgi:Tfp pilus assembly protein PilF
MDRLAFLLLLLVSAASPAWAGQPAVAATEVEQFNRLVVRAAELQQAGDALGAIDNYRAALTIIPDRVDVLTNMGAAFVQLGEFDQAIAQYEAALRISPSSTPARLNLALAYYKSGRPAQAIQPLRLVIANDPQAKNAYLILADCYLQTGEPQSAVTLLRPRESLFADDLGYAYVLGTALLETGDVSSGQLYIDRIFRAGETAEAHLLLGIAHLNRFDYPAAKEELERALQLNAKLPTANGAYGRALLGLGDPDAAEQAFRRELAINRNDFEANLAIGSIRKNAQKLADAEAYLTRARDIRPKEPTARKLLASLHMQTGRNEEALKLLEPLATEQPESVDVHVQLATVYNRLNRKEDAERERAIVDRLNAEEQSKQSGSRPDGQGGRPPGQTSPGGGSR